MMVKRVVSLLTKNECEYLSTLCSERISEMESDLEKKDAHSYVFVKSLRQN